MSAEQARTEADAGVAAGTAASADSEEKDVKIPVEDAVETADEKDDAPQTAGATDSIDAEEATMTEEEMSRPPFVLVSRLRTTILSSSSSRLKRSLPTYALSSTLLPKRRKLLRTRLTRLPSARLASRPTGRTSAVVRQTSAWRSASALPRSSCAPCCRWSTTSSVLSITLALWIWPMTSASS